MVNANRPQLLKIEMHEAAFLGEERVCQHTVRTVEHVLIPVTFRLPRDLEHGRLVVGASEPETGVVCPHLQCGREVEVYFVL